MWPGVLSHTCNSSTQEVEVSGLQSETCWKKKERKFKKNSIKCVNYCKKIQISISIQENVKLFKMFELEMGHDHNNGPVYCACLYSRDK